VVQGERTAFMRDARLYIHTYKAPHGMAGLGHEVLDWLNTGTGLFASTSAAALLAYSTYTLVHTRRGPPILDDDYLDDFIEVPRSARAAAPSLARAPIEINRLNAGNRNWSCILPPTRPRGRSCSSCFWRGERRARAHWLC
jgi:hypothetical protein